MMISDKMIFSENQNSNLIKIEQWKSRKSSINFSRFQNQTQINRDKFLR